MEPNEELPLCGFLVAREPSKHMLTSGETAPMSGFAFPHRSHRYDGMVPLLTEAAVKMHLT